jgi:lipopolysaccharide export system protein LptA
MKDAAFPARLIAAGFGAFLLVMAAAGGAMAQTADLFTGFQSKSTDPVQIDAASLEISEEGHQRISVFNGNVVVRRGDTTLRAATIRVYSDIGGGGRSKDPKAAKDAKAPKAAATTKGQKGLAFNRIEATGGVTVTSGEQKVTGSSVVVDMGKQTITMSGNVVLSQGSNVISGDRLIVDLASGKARVEQDAGKPIRGVFTPGSGSLSAPSQ